jgi:hypothetical protein
VARGLLHQLKKKERKKTTSPYKQKKKHLCPPSHKTMDKKVVVVDAGLGSVTITAMPDHVYLVKGEGHIGRLVVAGPATACVLVHEAAVATFDALIAPTCTVLIFGSMRFPKTKALLRCKTLTVHGSGVLHAPCLQLIAADCVHVRPGAAITVTDDFHISGKCRIQGKLLCTGQTIFAGTALSVECGGEALLGTLGTGTCNASLLQVAVHPGGRAVFTPLKNTLFGNVSVGGELVTTGGWQTRVLRVAQTGKITLHTGAAGADTATFKWTDVRNQGLILGVQEPQGKQIEVHCAQMDNQGFIRTQGGSLVGVVGVTWTQAPGACMHVDSGVMVLRGSKPTATVHVQGTVQVARMHVSNFAQVTLVGATLQCENSMSLDRVGDLTLHPGCFLQVRGALHLQVANAVRVEGVLHCGARMELTAASVLFSDDVVVKGACVLQSSGEVSLSAGASLEVQDCFAARQTALQVLGGASLVCGDLACASVRVHKGGSCTVRRGTHAACTWSAVVQGALTWTSAPCTAAGKWSMANTGALHVSGAGARVRFARAATWFFPQTKLGMFVDNLVVEGGAQIQVAADFVVIASGLDISGTGSAVHNSTGEVYVGDPLSGGAAVRLGPDTTLSAQGHLQVSVRAAAGRWVVGPGAVCSSVHKQCSVTLCGDTPAHNTLVGGVFQGTEVVFKNWARFVAGTVRCVDNCFVNLTNAQDLEFRDKCQVQVGGMLSVMHFDQAGAVSSSDRRGKLRVCGASQVHARRLFLGGIRVLDVQDAGTEFFVDVTGGFQVLEVDTILVVSGACLRLAPDDMVAEKRRVVQNTSQVVADVIAHFLGVFGKGSRAHVFNLHAKVVNVELQGQLCCTHSLVVFSEGPTKFVVDAGGHVQASEIQLFPSKAVGVIHKYEFAGRVTFRDWHPSLKKATLADTATVVISRKARPDELLGMDVSDMVPWFFNGSSDMPLCKLACAAPLRFLLEEYDDACIVWLLQWAAACVTCPELTFCMHGDHERRLLFPALTWGFVEKIQVFMHGHVHFCGDWSVRDLSVSAGEVFVDEGVTLQVRKFAWLHADEKMVLSPGSAMRVKGFCSLRAPVLLLHRCVLEVMYCNMHAQVSVRLWMANVAVRSNFALCSPAVDVDMSRVNVGKSMTVKKSEYARGGGSSSVATAGKGLWKITSEGCVHRQFGPTGSFDQRFWTCEYQDVVHNTQDKARVLVQGSLCVHAMDVQLLGGHLCSLGPIVFHEGGVLHMQDLVCYLHAEKRPGDKFQETHHSVRDRVSAVLGTTGTLDLDLKALFVKGASVFVFAQGGVDIRASGHVAWDGRDGRDGPSSHIRPRVTLVHGLPIELDSGSGSTQHHVRVFPASPFLPKTVRIVDSFLAFIAVHDAAMAAGSGAVASMMAASTAGGGTAAGMLHALCDIPKGEALQAVADVQDTCLVAVFDSETKTFRPVLVLSGVSASSSSALCAARGAVHVTAGGGIGLARASIVAQDDIVLRSGQGQVHCGVHVASTSGSVTVATETGSLALVEDHDVHVTRTESSAVTTCTSVPCVYAAGPQSQVSMQAIQGAVNLTHVVVPRAAHVDVAAKTGVTFAAGSSYTSTQTVTVKRNLLHTAVRCTDTTITTRHACSIPVDATLHVQVSEPRAHVVVEEVDGVVPLTIADKVVLSSSGDGGDGGPAVTVHAVPRTTVVEQSCKTRALNAPVAALLSIGVGYATAGAGASLLGTLGVSATPVAVAAANAAVSAAAVSGTLQAATGDRLDMPAIVREAGRAAVCAGLTAGLSTGVVPDRVVSTAVKAAVCPAQAWTAVVDGVHGACAESLGGMGDRVLATGLHAAVGAAAGAAAGGGSLEAAVSGAVGAAVAEATAEGFSGCVQAAAASALGQAAAVVATAALGLDVDTAARVAQVAAVNNFEGHHRDPVSSGTVSDDGQLLAITIATLDGVWDFMVDSVEGLVFVTLHPVDAARGIASAAWNYERTAEAVKHHYLGLVDFMRDASVPAPAKVRLGTKIFLEVASLPLPLGGGGVKKLGAVAGKISVAAGTVGREGMFFPWLHLCTYVFFFYI